MLQAMSIIIIPALLSCPDNNNFAKPNVYKTGPEGTFMSFLQSLLPVQKPFRAFA